jgi:hypothetical protein
MYDSVKREKNEINMRVSKQNFAIEVEGMKAVCPLGEVVGKKMIAEEKIPVISCEGGCFRGEIARMTETSEITTSFADSTLAVESIRAAAKTVEETHLIVVPGEWSEAVIRKSSDMTTPAGQRIPLCPHRTGSTLKCDADRQSTIPNLTWVDYLLIVGLSVVCALVFNRYHSKKVKHFLSTPCHITFTNKSA